MSSRRAAADAAAVARLTRVCLRVGFWVPLFACTWLALTPSPPEAVFRISDVVLHALAFAYLTFALGLAHAGLRTWAILSWMLGYGVFIELVQSIEPQRSAELKDLLVDAAGIGVGLVLLAVLGAWSRRTVHAVLAAALPGGRD